MSGETDTSIAVSSETREELRMYKRHGISYDELLNRMIEQYEPKERAV